MPIETGQLCQHCVDEHGQLQSFEVRFARMTQWQARRDPDKDRSEIEAETVAWMSTMPAWKDHPEVLARLPH